jgi:hypothetical protein
MYERKYLIRENKKITEEEKITSKGTVLSQWLD